ncbi:Hypothetical predicted protein [Cloeon dipterum]|uniref:RNA polymerase II subunit B1 CTD phosphatase RPAP2 homolog n=1 Tax=Cloeon dipterum TaxID=197152 RepID=A0A8S1D291_9INSE|nr:Hypothetical predicted protein [Cloeon dipterum]
MERTIFPKSINGKTVTVGEKSTENSQQYRDARAKEKTEASSILYKQECFKRSRRIVEQLLEKDISEEYLLENVKYISQTDYDDVVVERAIVKLCGYPVCSNLLGPVPKKQFHISLATNKVYDLTDRKNYCSNWCYKASNYFKDQVLTSPVWFREHEVHHDYHLLTHTGDSGKPGEEVAMQIDSLNISEKKVKVERPTVNSFAFAELEQYHNDGIFNHDSLEIKENSTNCEAGDMEVCYSFHEERKSEPAVKKMPVESQRPATTCWANGGDVNLSQFQIPRAPKIPKMLPEHKVEPVEVEQIPAESEGSRKVPKRIDRAPCNARPESVKFDAEKVVKFINEWFTMDTLQMVLGAKKLYERLRSKIDSLSSASDAPDWKPTVESKLLQICKTLSEKGGQEQQPEDDRVACSELELKVAAFYQGKTSYVIESPESSKVSPILPIVDRYEQKQARKKIILTRLEKIVPDIAEILRIAIDDLGLKMQMLADTFNLTAHNIMMKPQEWNFMGLIVLQLLISSDHDPQRFVSKKSTKVMKAMLKSCNLKEDFLDLLIIQLVDVDRILAKLTNT